MLFSNWNVFGLWSCHPAVDWLVVYQQRLAATHITRDLATVPPLRGMFRLGRDDRKSLDDMSKTNKMNVGKVKCKVSCVCSDATV